MLASSDRHAAAHQRELTAHQVDTQQASKLAPMGAAWVGQGEHVAALELGSAGAELGRSFEARLLDDADNALAVERYHHQAARAPGPRRPLGGYSGSSASSSAASAAAASVG